MISSLNIVTWNGQVPWAEQRQVEQDLIICRALVALYSDGFLRKALRFRGGTKPQACEIPRPSRYFSGCGIHGLCYSFVLQKPTFLEALGRQEISHQKRPFPL